jgi:diaminohydroxyphosphoribosylaminopyrimidine deaminase / 5-amino-6-(5-phosphoribosylamino)uracil reductase
LAPSSAEQLNALDRERLTEALALAETAVGVSDPNPRVGCVVGSADGRVFGRGATQRAGGPHAEVMALRDARAAGHDLAGATAWVTLEPCAHHGRTPPCADALVAAGLGRVVVATGDPFPAVAGAGLARLRAAGLQVVLAGGELGRASQELNIGFFSRVLRGRPWVRLKAAASLDGRTALPNGRSQWITGPEARADGHAWRRRAGAVLSGIGTVLADDPRLDVRLVPTVLQPLRVVVDSQLRLPPDARTALPPGQLMLVTTATGEALERLRERGIECVTLPGADGRIDLPALLSLLAGRGVNELHVEAGATLNGALWQAGLVDELLLYVAPCLLGDGVPVARLPPLQALDGVARWQFTEARTVGADLRLRLRAADPAEWLHSPAAANPETRDAGRPTAGG